MSSEARVFLYGTEIGAVSWDEEMKLARFAYDENFLSSGIEPSPLHMPLNSKEYYFPELRERPFHGLPGMLADSLPDDFGNLLINQWLDLKGISKNDFTQIDRLCYMGKRGMGALEYVPEVGEAPQESTKLSLENLLEVSNLILQHREDFKTVLDEGNITEEAVLDIIRVGTSAGGARPKAVIAYNRETGEIRSGQCEAPEGFAHYLIKFDGTIETQDRGQKFGEGQGYTNTEYAYYLMAKKAGIEMSKTELLREGERSHFMTRRYDRPTSNGKIHTQSYCGLAHASNEKRAAFSYEQVINDMERMGIGHKERVQLFRRAMFNIMSRNQDDHTKNVGFIMERSGQWALSPAYDISFAMSNDPSKWTHKQQMTLNAKNGEFEYKDFVEAAKNLNLLNPRKVKAIYDEIGDALSQWKKYARKAEVPKDRTERIQKILNDTSKSLGRPYRSYDRGS